MKTGYERFYGIMVPKNFELRIFGEKLKELKEYI
jgi:hypothetical protein